MVRKLHETYFENSLGKSLDLVKLVRFAGDLQVQIGYQLLVPINVVVFANLELVD